MQSVTFLLPSLQEGMKQCLSDFQKNLPWVERLDLSNIPVPDLVAKAEGKQLASESGAVNAEDDFQREMYL